MSPTTIERSREMNHVCAVAVTATIAVFGSESIASCRPDGTAEQTVHMSSDGKQLKRWTPVLGEIQRVRLSNGFELGLQIEPATAEKYRELLARSQVVPELVKISLFDMAGTTPALLSTTWGGANSKQGFGPRGGANGVPIMGQQIELWLHKPTCITPATLASKG
jgi:hypothetical protein